MPIVVARTGAAGRVVLGYVVFNVSASPSAPTAASAAERGVEPFAELALDGAARKPARLLARRRRLGLRLGREGRSRGCCAVAAAASAGRIMASLGLLAGRDDVHLNLRNPEGRHRVEGIRVEAEGAQSRTMLRRRWPEGVGCVKEEGRAATVTVRLAVGRRRGRGKERRWTRQKGRGCRVVMRA